MTCQQLAMSSGFRDSLISHAGLCTHLHVSATFLHALAFLFSMQHVEFIAELSVSATKELAIERSIKVCHHPCAVILDLSSTGCICQSSCTNSIATNQKSCCRHVLSLLHASWL
jgi:hypothetical protein